MADVVVAPFANSDIREWPGASYAALIDALLAWLPEHMAIRVVGTPNQFLRACAIVRSHDAARVTNECGLLSAQGLADMVRSAACVIGNNSGVTHLAARYGVPTLCIFGGSHQRLEWRPLGPTVRLMSRAIGCSPCELDRAAHCPYSLACLRAINPAEAADAALALLETSGISARSRAP